MAESCALDVADRDGATLEEVGALLNLTREHVRQIEVRAMAKVLAVAPEMREMLDRPGRTVRRLPVFQDGDGAIQERRRGSARSFMPDARPINPMTGERVGTVYDRVMAAFVVAGRPLGLDDLVPLGMTRKSLGVYLSQLAAKLKLVWIGRGRYRLRAAATSAPPATSVAGRRRHEVAS